jgi:predicted nucleotidyltransferase
MNDNTKKKESDPVLSEMVKRLVAEFRPYKIYLFGSRATKHARQDSDYDLLIVMPSPEENIRALQSRAYQILDDLEVAMDILFTNKITFDRRKTVANTPAEIATTEGKVLYAA